MEHTVRHAKRSAEKHGAKDMSEALFTIQINDEGHMSVAVRKDFWKHEDQEVIMHVLTIATFLLSEHPDVLEAKNDFVVACSEAIEGGASVVPRELSEMEGAHGNVESDFDFDELDERYGFCHPYPKEVQ